MNIYALKGHKVKVKTFNAGYSYDQNIAKEHLELDKEYTVDKTNVGPSNTDVYLREVPLIRFNSVFFEDVTEQSDEDNKRHRHYSMYH